MGNSADRVPDRPEPGFSTDPVVRLTLSLADYSVRRLAPVVLDRVAAEIEASRCPVQPGASGVDWQSLAGIVASFRRTGRELVAMAPLTLDTAGHAYEVLDHVRTGVDWVLWPGGDRRDDLHHLVIDAMMPAAHARAAYQHAQENPQTWQEQYGEPLAASLAQLVGQAIREVRRTCRAVEEAGVRADDLAAFLGRPDAAGQI
jgi:hypothetical protein